MCFEFDHERLEAFRKELEKLEALKKSEEKAHVPAKPDVPEKDPGPREPIPA